MTKQALSQLVDLCADRSDESVFGRVTADHVRTARRVLATMTAVPHHLVA